MYTLTWRNLESFATIERALRAIPIEETSLEFSMNNLGHHHRFIKQFFAAIPTHFTSLDLSYNVLFYATVDELKTIPAGIAALNLFGNNFGYLEGPRLAQTFAAVSEGRRVINLSNNGLWHKTTEELVQALSAISLSVIDLDLSFNGLYERTDDQLEQILHAIPAINLVVTL